ncbi:MAG: ABC transporter permease [Alphaproteobacteria bacterium]|nr:ABC transporter permease [Alphaproteobacteria bacterium]
MPEIPHDPFASATAAAASHAGVNWRGLYTLTAKEVRRFLKVWVQTLGAPVVTTLLFLAVFVLALGETKKVIGTTPYESFLGAGLIMMAIAQNAFSNAASSLVISKMQGSIIDLVMAPLSPAEFLCGFALGALVRGLAVGLVVGLAMALFVPFGPFAPAYALFHALAAALMLGLLGVLSGLWAEKFDQMATIQNFIVTPLAFLSGTFYSIERLPEGLRIAALCNPFFYMIDGFRYGLTGHHDGPLLAGVAVMAGVVAGLWLFTLALVRRGYNLKS